VFAHIRLALAILALCFLPEQILAATLRQEANPRPERSLLDESKGVIVPFEYYRQHIFLTVTVNGTPGMVFLLDTGTSIDILDLTTSRSLGIPLENITKAKDLGLGSGKVSVAGAHNIAVQLGALPLAETVAIIDLSGLEKSYGHRTDGIIGFPMLKRYVVAIDFERHELTFWPSHGYKYRGSGDRMELGDKGNLPTIPVTVNTLSRRQQNAVVEVDTGSDASLMLYPQFAHHSHLEEEFLQMNPRQAYGLGGYFPVRLGVLDSMTMGNTMVTRFTAFLMQTSPEVTRRKVSGIIGTSVLGSYRKIIFDVPRGEIIFERPPATPTLWRQASLGRQ
jgi:Aspartyl protease